MSSGMEPTAIIDLPPQRHPQPAPRERILAAARELLFCHGIRAVGVDAIAEAAGTNKMTLYRHFASKDELVAEYLRKVASTANHCRSEERRVGKECRSRRSAEY